jgi:ketosteroid isomerase-like protein
MTPITITPPATDSVTTVRRFFVAWEAGDVSELADLVDPNAVLGPILGLLYERAVYRGRGDVARAFAETAIRWDRLDIHVRAARLDETGCVYTVLQLAFAKHGMSSDMAIAVRCRVADGRITSVEDA